MAVCRGSVMSPAYVFLYFTYNEARKIDSPARSVIDAKGCYVLPGLVDLASGDVVFHRGTVIPRRTRLLTTECAASRPPDARLLNPAGSGLYPGEGR
jgi:alpha-D-ribose 1-methylphosphonate 5-triphosphate diphosphatase PhnM